MRRFFSFGLLLFFVVLLTTVTVQAAVTCPDHYSPSPAGVCIPGDTGLSQASVEYILEVFMKWLLSIFGFLAIIAFVISGIQYLTAAGSEDQAGTAKRNMQYSIVGVIVALSGLVILTAINAALQGNANF